jgi:hypothetical protein
MDRNQELRLLRSEVQALEVTATSDFESEVWASWPRLIEEFNALNQQAKSLGVHSAIDPIQPVPDGRLAHLQGLGAGMPDEKAKVSEIISKASRLRQRVDMATDYKPNPEGRLDPVAALRLVCGRFHSVATQLRSRYDDRETLKVADEYDVQDLMHALLRIFFDDIRPEEWTPSYAGQSARMDFLLKAEKIAIETKKTRKGLGVRETGAQLILDIEHYKKHPECEHLVCFIYDPDNKIANPRGLESDLTREEGQFSVTVFVVPKHT